MKKILSLFWTVLFIVPSMVGMYVPGAGRVEEFEEQPVFPGTGYNDILYEYFPSSLTVVDNITKEEIPLLKIAKSTIEAIKKGLDQKSPSSKNIYKAIFQYYIENPAALLQKGKAGYLNDLGGLFVLGSIDLNQPFAGSHITPLEYAIMHNNSELVKFLLKKSINIPASAIESARKSSNPEMLKAIFESSAYKNAR
jgi:hypothetical protein